MNNEVCVSFYLYSSTIRLHLSTIKGLNNPPFVKFLVNFEENAFAIQACSKQDLSSTRVHVDTSGKIEKAEIYSQTLCGVLIKINAWNPNASYRIYGKAFPGQNVAVFRFVDSVIVNDVEGEL